MKVLAITPQYLPALGGIEVLVGMLATSFRKKAVETVVVTDKHQGRLLPDHELIDSIPVYRFPFLNTLHARDTVTALNLVKRLDCLLAEIRPDLIHMHSAVQGGAWAVERALKKLSPCPPFVVTQHSLLQPEDSLNVVRTLMLRADVLTAVSQAALDSAIAFSQRADATLVIPNGVSEHETTPRPDRFKPPFALTCVGRLQREKGFDLAIAALAQVRARGLDANLLLIGQGEHRSDFENAAAAFHGMEPHVRFAGVLDHAETRRAIADSTLVLAPSRTREGFSLVAAEAAMAGVPCIASRIGGLAETVQDGVTGILVPPEDVSGLAGAIAGVLTDQSRLQLLSTNAQSMAGERFNMDKCAERYLKLYRDLVGRPHARPDVAT
ncbi:glycosyltransferase family 4 protein [Rhodoplanes sp. Z2-YC6860]|uniref:glycosyltransferase family 4 protein n=1 Tax=Rhodoplanes sp. Z2-YC6860 TaxID=674703 RepID=UPI00078DC66A|nr:glycosyltransferase family 4 protein [Rhodoplanes sp. Z2-YC6860]AMN39833.1 glycosyltransferase [Rhodoplanes sp. Z2-YC6860]